MSLIRKKKPKSGKFSVINNLSRSSIFDSNSNGVSKSPKKMPIYIQNQASTTTPHSDSDGEDLIDLKKLPSTKDHKLNAYSQLDKEKLDKIIQQEHSKLASTPYSIKKSFASNLLGTDNNLLSNFQKIQEPKIASLKEKFQKFDIPPPTSSKRTLKSRVMKHKAIIPDILNGSIASHYYNLANQQYKSSNNSSMTTEDNWQINWSKFIGGYYGLKRQQFIALILLSEFKLLIQNVKNATVNYWNYNQFTTYVLANEIIIRLVMEDMGYSQSKAELFLEDTQDYGQYITDTVPLVDDLGLEEKLFAQESSAMIQEISKPKPKKAKVVASKDVLDDLLSDSDSNWNTQFALRELEVFS